uniref:Coiled-coil domain-containing protein 30 n=1 Tax=Bubo bubo TaxID=30461 RepID=A0A8C0EV75_BUBBB
TVIVFLLVANDEFYDKNKQYGCLGCSKAKPVLLTSFFLFCTDRTELQEAMEHNSRLDKEILTLRARVQTLDLERKLGNLSGDLSEKGSLIFRGFHLSLSDERFQQQEEKMQQLRQNLRRVQNLCSSAERELRYEREKNVDLQKQNLLLQQECTKVKAELKQTQAKLSDTTETCSCLSAQWEKSQQKVKELEQELLKCSQADKLQSSLQEKLAQEKSKVCEAQKKISKLQQKLKDSQHQLLLAEAHVSDKKLLEEELKEARENEARVQQELHEELLKRYPGLGKARAACRGSVLESQCSHSAFSCAAKSCWVPVQALKSLNKYRTSPALVLTQNTKAFCSLMFVSCLLRKYNEMQLRHKDKIRRAKETFIHEVKQRDSRIKQLENELSESKLQVEKGKVLIAQITAENEKLLQERRRLLQKITDQEETPWSNRATIATLQSR